MKRHVSFTDSLGLALLVLTFSAVIWEDFNQKSIWLFFSLLILGEIAVQWRWRMGLNCPQCGFDPLLYQRNQAQASTRVRHFYEQRQLEPDFLLKGQALLSTQKRMQSASRLKLKKSRSKMQHPGPLILFFLSIMGGAFYTNSTYGQASPLATQEELPNNQQRKSTRSSLANSHGGQSAVVGEDGATIYQGPDFDSQTIGNLSPGKKTKISRRTIKGRTGLGFFYKIRLEDGRLGFVADTEVIPEFQKIKGKKATVNPTFREVQDNQERARSGLDPVYFTRYGGGGVGILGFSEKFKGQTLRDHVLMYSLRFTGPGILFDGPPLDVNLSFSLHPPRYYNNLSQAPPSGFFIFTDISLLLPMAEWVNGLLYYGLGVMFTYTRFRVQANSEYIDSQELRMGAVGSAGYAHRYKKWVARADIKYYFERSTYFGYGLAVQHEF